MINEISHAIVKDGIVVDVLVFDITKPEVIEDFVNILNVDHIISLKDREDLDHAGIGATWDGQSFFKEDPLPN